MDDLVRLVDLHTRLPECVQEDSAELIRDRFTAYAERKRRELNGANLTALILVIAVGGAVTYALVLVAVSTEGFWPWASGIVAGLVGLLTLGLTLVGVSQLYAPKSTKEDAV